MTGDATPLVALPDGTVLPAHTPLVRADDLGLLRGDGVFETTLVVGGQPRDLDEHLARLQVSASWLELPLPPASDWLPGIAALVAGWTGGREMVMRLVATRGPAARSDAVCYLLGGSLSAASAHQRRAGVRVLTLDRGFTAASASAAPWLLAGAKTLSYGVNMAALRYAAAHEADDVIFVGADALVLEAPTASVVLASGGVLRTPAPVGILDGITVRRLFRAATESGWQIGRSTLTVADLRAAEGVWLVSSARLLAPVTAIDGAPLGDPDRRAALTGELARLLDVPGF